jgi:hypothetical protein
MLVNKRDPEMELTCPITMMPKITILRAEEAVTGMVEMRGVAIGGLLLGVMTIGATKEDAMTEGGSMIEDMKTDGGRFHGRRREADREVDINAIVLEEDILSNSSIVIKLMDLTMRAGHEPPWHESVFRHIAGYLCYSRNTIRKVWSTCLWVSMGFCST